MNTLQGAKPEFNYILADGGSVPFRLTAKDRADCCGSRAYFKATLHSGSTLLFCNHHYNAHRAALRLASTRIEDEHQQLIENRLQGSEN